MTIKKRSCLLNLLAIWKIITKSFLFTALVLVALSSIGSADESLDTREGEDVMLKCRFTEQRLSEEFSYYWARWTTNPPSFENVAIGNVQLNTNYK